LLLWVDKGMFWRTPRDGRPLQPAVFCDAAIQFCLSIKMLFKLPLRQASVMVANRLKLAGLHWLMPDFSTLWRKQTIRLVMCSRNDDQCRSNWHAGYVDTVEYGIVGTLAKKIQDGLQ
jgi:hypothetical protein